MRHKKKRAQIEEDSHEMVHDESNWLVSYADMMTLLMGFFVLMYSFSRVDREKFDVVAKEVAQYFGGEVVNNPTVVKVDKEIKKIIEKLNIEKDDVAVKTTSHGIILRFNGELLFKSGSAQLDDKMLPAMTEIVNVIRDQNSLEGIKVEGHTDDDPIYSPVFPTNWELSTARASRVVRQFEAAGVSSTLLTAMGFSDSRPVQPNRDKVGNPIKENQKTNRRVEITVSFGGDLKQASKALKDQDFAQNKKSANVDSAKSLNDLSDEEVKVKIEAAKVRVKAAKAHAKAVQRRKREQSKRDALRKKLLGLQKQADKMEGNTRGISSKEPKEKELLPKAMDRKKGIQQLNKRLKDTQK